MASIVEKKFEWFEQHLRENLKEHTLASPFYIGIPKAEDDIFMVFYLRVLLDKLDMQKSLSMISVPDSDRANPRLGYRTSVPVPKGGISAIKVGEVPKFDLDEMIKNTLTKAIKDYLAAAATSPNLTKELANNTDLVKITRTELKNLEKPLMASYSFVKSIFHISDYLRSNNTKFITNRVIDNIRNLHNACVADVFKVRFPEKQDGATKIYLNPTDWLSVRLGIIPLGVYPDIPSEEELPGIMNKFRNGDAAQFVISEFLLEPIEEFKGLIDKVYDASYGSLENEDIKSLRSALEPIQILHDFHKNTLLNIYQYDSFIETLIIKNIDSLCCKNLYSAQYAIQMYLTGVSNGDTNIPAIKELLYDREPSTENGSFAGSFESLVNSFIRNDDDSIIIKKTETRTITVTDPNTGKTTTQTVTDVVQDMTDTYYKYLLDINGAYNFIYADMVKMQSASAKTSDIWTDPEENLQGFFKNDWFAKFTASEGSIQTAINNFTVNGSISKTKITSANLLALNTAFNSYFADLNNTVLGIINSLRNTLDYYTENKDSIRTTVDAEFVVDTFSSLIDNYAIKEYKGTIICYKT